MRSRGCVNEVNNRYEQGKVQEKEKCIGLRTKV